MDSSVLEADVPARSFNFPFLETSVGPPRWRRLEDDDDDVLVLLLVELDCWCWGSGLAAKELKLRLNGCCREGPLVEGGEEEVGARPKSEACACGCGLGWKVRGVILRGEVRLRVGGSTGEADAALDAGSWGVG